MSAKGAKVRARDRTKARDLCRATADAGPGPPRIVAAERDPVSFYQAFPDQAGDTPIASMAFAGKPRCSIRSEADGDNQIGRWGGYGC